MIHIWFRTVQDSMYMLVLVDVFLLHGGNLKLVQTQPIFIRDYYSNRWVM